MLMCKEMLADTELGLVLVLKRVYIIIAYD